MSRSGRATPGLMTPGLMTPGLMKRTDVGVMGCGEQRGVCDPPRSPFPAPRSPAFEHHSAPARFPQSRSLRWPCRTWGERARSAAADV